MGNWTLLTQRNMKISDMYNIPIFKYRNVLITSLTLRHLGEWKLVDTDEPV